MRFNTIMKNTSYLLSHQVIRACFLLSIVWICSCKPDESKPKEIVQNYGTGQVSRRYTEVNHKKEGLMTDYYPSGKLKAERLFENDMQVGKTTLYYESGKTKEVQYYQDGKLAGGDTVFYEDGKPQMMLNFTSGVKNGYIRSWGPDGSITYEAKYSMDTLVEVKGKAIEPDTMHIEGYSSQKGFRK